MSISGTDEVVAQLGRWSPGDLAFIEALSYRSRPDDSATRRDEGATLVIESLWQSREGVKTWPSATRPWHRVGVTFAGVSQLRVAASANPIQVMGFDIHDLSGRGLEGIAFEIEDYEDGRISFYCASIRVMSVAPVEPRWGDVVKKLERTSSH